MCVVLSEIFMSLLRTSEKIKNIYFGKKESADLVAGVVVDLIW